MKKVVFDLEFDSGGGGCGGSSGFGGGGGGGSGGSSGGGSGGGGSSGCGGAQYNFPLISSIVSLNVNKHEKVNKH